MTCVPCKNSCSLCSGIDNCTQCKSGFFLYGTDCIDTCPEGQFGDDVQNKCTQCPTTCSLCDSAKICTDCKDNDNYYLTGKPNLTAPLEIMCEPNDVAHQILETYCAKNEY